MNINYLATCYPDDFQGSSDPVLCVSAYPSQTFEMLGCGIIEAIESDTDDDYSLDGIDYEKVVNDYITSLNPSEDLNALCNEGLDLAENSGCNHYYSLTFED